VVIHEPVLEISCGQKQCAHTQTDRHTPLTTRPDGLRRAGKDVVINRPSQQCYAGLIELCRKLVNLEPNFSTVDRS